MTYRHQRVTARPSPTTEPPDFRMTTNTSELLKAAKAVLGTLVDGVPIATAECMCCGDGMICPFHYLEEAVQRMEASE